MKKVVRWSLCMIVFLAVWAALLNDIPFSLQGPIRELVKVVRIIHYKSQSNCLKSPLYLLIVFGCYSLAVIGFNLMTFPECEAESKSLEQVKKINNERKFQEISHFFKKERTRAIAFYKTKGIIIKEHDE